MTYPQPNSNAPSTGGQGFFRLNTLLVSDGDIYESEQGAHGFAIGPNSDISRVTIGYFDLEAVNFLNKISLSPGRPFPGFVQAANDSGLYVPSNRPGRILIWPEEIFNAQFQPEFGGIGDGRVDIEVPRLDVIEYFAQGPATPGRVDKSYYMEDIPWTATDAWYWVLPFYGRRYASISFYYQDVLSAQTVSLKLVGVNYMLTDDNAAAATETILQDTVVVTEGYGTAAAQGFRREILASTDGMFDAIYVKLTHSTPGAWDPGRTPLTITVSDTEV